MRKSIRLLSPLAGVLVLVAAFATPGCNTVSGFGKDTQKAGEKIEDEADRHIEDRSDAGQAN
jgi:predicted small secreted protein